MEIRNLKTFKKIAELGSFTKAAQVLGYAQSTITFQLQAIEDYYGRPVFERLGKSIRLTPFGQKLLDNLDILLRDYERLEQLNNEESEPDGILRLGAPESLMMYRLHPIIKEYKELYPKVQIVIINDQCEFLRNRLNSGELDISFLLQPNYIYENFKTLILREEPMCLVAPANHESEDFLPSSSQMVLYTEKECTYRQEFERYMRGQNFFPTNILETQSVEAIKKYILSDLGVSYLPRYSVEKEAEEGLLKIKPFKTELQLFTQIIYHKNKWINPAIKEFIELSQKHSRKWI
jgi:DNA-binding transcriptional LysR family regulator